MLFRSKRDIGAIRIDKHESLVEISQDKVESFLAAIGDEMRLEGAALKQVDGPPKHGDPKGKAPKDRSRHDGPGAPRGAKFNHRKGGFKPKRGKTDGAEPTEFKGKSGKPRKSAAGDAAKLPSKNDGAGTPKAPKKKGRRADGSKVYGAPKPRKPTKKPPGSTDPKGGA